ncbi:hypothetical protein Leryth_021565 [Lithospermum erythrorhizon]|nr:hypothetical protein Leryth_021565 [Lithospermum erythrorhizon]
MMKAGLVEAGEASKAMLHPKKTRGLAVFDLVLRLLAIAGTVGSAVGMGQAEQVLPFSTQFFRFDAQYDDFGEFQLFIIVNSIVCGYLALSLPVSVLHVVRRRASGKSRVMLVFLDTIILALLTAGASAAAAMVYLAHNGNSAANCLIQEPLIVVIPVKTPRFLECCCPVLALLIRTFYSLHQSTYLLDIVSNISLRLWSPSAAHRILEAE